MIRIGKIVATHGLAGSLIMTHVAGRSNWLKKGHVLMVEMQKGSFIPYFVATCKPAKDDEYHLMVEDVNTQQEAKKLVTKQVYVDEALLAGMERESPLLWIGFTVSDKHYGDVGKIEDVMQAGAQWIAKLNYKNNEALIPLVDATLLAVDIKDRILKTDLPEGLLELYEQGE
jgi:16S rRNA processing protein RimM